MKLLIATRGLGAHDVQLMEEASIDLCYRHDNEIRSQFRALTQ